MLHGVNARRVSAGNGNSTPKAALRESPNRCRKRGVWEAIQSNDVGQGVGTGAAWLVTVCLLVAGMIGCVLPVLPGHLIILIGVIAYRLMLGAESGLHWWSFAILVVLMAISQTFEMLSGAAGSKWFGGTRWGAIGAVVGQHRGDVFPAVRLVAGAVDRGVCL